MVSFVQIAYITLQLSIIHQTYSQWSEFDNVHNCENNNKIKGRCQLKTKCKAASSTRRSYKICGYYQDVVKRIEVICCPDVNEYLKPIESSYYPGMTVSEQKCLDYNLERERRQLLRNELSTPECVYQNNICMYPGFAAGGFNAEKDEFPHMAALGWEKDNGKDYDWQCGGSLISKDYVLTAGHCLYDPSHISPEPSVVRLGDWIPRIVKISSIIVHPEYKPPRKYNDIALLKLAENIEFSTDIWPACLHFENRLPKNVTGTGWGELSPGGERPKRLQKVFLETFDLNTCSRYYPKSRAQPDGIVRSQFCAGYERGGRDTCRGDSGGPLQIKSKNFKDAFEIVGITSFGVECGSAVGGVYTKVNQYLEWIQNIVWPGSKNL